MAGTATFNIFIDRSLGNFDISVDYYIPGYNDPETGEQFYETYWNFGYSGSDGSYGYGGYGWDTGYGSINLGFAGDTVADGTLDFYAYNWFSGEDVQGRFHVLNAALAVNSVTLTAATTDGDAILVSGSAADTLTGAGGNDVLDAGEGNDTLVGGAGDDDLQGGAGADSMSGGAGNDVYYIDDAGDTITESSGGGYDQVLSLVSITLAANVEGVVLWSGDAQDATGNSEDNSLYGNNSVNVLSGLDGNDELYGYAGNDTLIGGNGDDRLDGGLGDDTMTGGAGDDHYVVNHAGDRIIEAPGGGIDEARIDGLASYTLGAAIEDLTNISNLPVFTGVGNGLANVLSGAAGEDRLYGVGGADRLVGGDGNDLLEGGAGADQLVGGNGVDTASYSGAGTAVTVNLGGLAGTGDAAGDTFDSIENVIGSRFGDTLTGNSANNYLFGRAGDDQLSGGGGFDWFVGGLGADTLNGDGDDGASYAGSTAAVTVNLATQTASGGDATGDVLIGINRVEGSALGDVLTGSEGANLLIGGGGGDAIDGAGGDDVIRGGAGADALIGGSGIDTLDYTGSAFGVRINLGTGHASDGDAAGDSFSGFERVTGSAHADILTAGASGNTLAGGSGADILTGGSGNDTVIGGAGADTLAGGTGIDLLSYESSSGNITIDLASGFAYGSDALGDTFTGFENLRGGRASDALYGNAISNVISGGDGGDYIDGRGGNDVIVGGTGDDAFLLGPDSGLDRIRDFTAGGTEDRIVIVWDASYGTFDQIMAAAQQQGANTVITLAAGIGVVLEGVNKADLTAADFVF